MVKEKETKIETPETIVEEKTETVPEVKKEGIVMVEEDGKRFDFICKYCGESINTYFLWSHNCL